MRILAISKDCPNANWAGTEALLREEARHVWDLQMQEVIQEIWFAKPESDAVLVLECQSLEEAHVILNGFPLVRAGLIEFGIRQIVPYDGYERLFGNESSAG